MTPRLLADLACEAAEELPARPVHPRYLVAEEARSLQRREAEFSQDFDHPAHWSLTPTAERLAPEQHNAYPQGRWTQRHD